MRSLSMDLTVLGDSYFWLLSKTLILPKHSCTRTCWKRRSKAGSYASNTGATAVESQHWGEFSLENLHNIWAFSMYCRYSSKVVAPTQRNSPLASSGFRRFPASIASFQTRSVAQMTAWLCVCVCVCGTSHLVPVQCQLQVHYLRAASTLYDGKVRRHLHQHPQSYGFPQAIRSVKIRTIQWLQMNGVQSFCIVSFIDEGDDLAIWVLDFFQYSFQSFFEFTLGSAAVWRC